MARRSDYPAYWPKLARFVKERAGWRCVRCGAKHGPPPDVLTVHHLDGNKRNCRLWNLAALCQRCHLRIQARVDFYRPWILPHSPWMAWHVQLYNVWARKNGRPVLPLNGVEPRSYKHEWADER